MFAHLNDDVLFGEVWNEEAIDVKTKCIITVVSLMASGITDSSLSYHLQNAKAHGVTKEEISAIVTLNNRAVEGQNVITEYMDKKVRMRYICENLGDDFLKRMVTRMVDEIAFAVKSN